MTRPKVSNKSAAYESDREIKGITACTRHSHKERIFDSDDQNLVVLKLHDLKEDLLKARRNIGKYCLELKKLFGNEVIFEAQPILDIKLSKLKEYVINYLSWKAWDETHPWD